MREDFAQPPVQGAPEAPETGVFGWVIVVSSMFWPRAGILAFWIFSDLLGRAYDHWIVPVAGFVVLPWTTIAYAMMWGASADGVHGAEWVVVAIGVLLDLGTYGLTSRLRA